MGSSLDLRGDPKEQTRWWAVGLGLGLTALVAYLALGYYKSAVPQGHFDDGVIAMREGKWMLVRRSATALKAAPDFVPHLSYLEAALKVNDKEFDTARKLLIKAKENGEVKPLALALEGMIEFQQGDIEKARAAAEAALKLEPELHEAEQLLLVLEEADTPMARVVAANLAMDKNDPEGVQREVLALLEMPGGAPYAEFILGVLEMRQNRYAAALEKFGKSKDEPELQVQSFVLSAEALIRLGDPSSAVGLLTQVVQLEPNFTDAHRLLAEIFYNQGADTAAVMHLRRVAELDPTDHRPLWKMGLMNFDFQDWSGAVSHYNEALARNPPLTIQGQIMLGKAQALVKLARFEEALAILDSPIVSQVQEIEFRTKADVTRAQCLFDAGKTDEALVLAQGVLDRNPTTLDALILKGMVLADKGRFPEAVDALFQATSLDPYDYLAHYQLSQAYNGAGNTAAAQQMLLRADQLKKLREDFSTLHERADADPGNVEIKIQLGETALLLGQNQMAMNWFAAALGLQPDHPQARQRLEELSRAAAPRQ